MGILGSLCLVFTVHVASTQETGIIYLAPDTVATAVATGPNPSEREKLAADELVAYLTRISGKKLSRIEREDAEVPEE